MTVLKKKYGCEATHGDNPTLPHHDWTDHLIENISILSRTTGRIRFLIDFKGDEILSDCLRREIAKTPSVRLSYYNYNTRSALVFFDEGKTSPVEVTKAVMRAVVDFGRRHGFCEIGESHTHDDNVHVFHGKHDHNHEHNHNHNHDHDHSDGDCASGHDDCGHDHSGLETQAEIQREIVKLAFTGAGLGFLIWRRLRGAAPLLAFGPMNTVGALMTIAAGYPIFKGGLKSLKKGQKLTDDTLISIAVAATLLMRENITGLSVVWLINIGRLLEAVTLRKSREQIKGLLDLTPDEVWKIVEDAKSSQPKLVKTKVQEIELGDTVRVFKADRVALDGVVVRGAASAIESHLNGEPLPKSKAEGDRVFAGSILDSGEIDFRVESLANETILAKIVHEVERLRNTKAPIEKYGQKFASTFVPVSLAISGGVFLLTRDWRRAITSLVIACPCAAGLATPTAVSASIGRAARKGILLKGGVHLEEASKIDTVVFDKTGTLTAGYPHIVAQSHFTEKLSEDDVLRFAALTEQYSTHPLARGILKAARKKSIELEPLHDYELIEGKGVQATVDGKTVLVGSERLLKERKVVFGRSPAAKLKKIQEAHAATFVHVAVEGRLVGTFVFEDTIRADALNVIGALKERGIARIILLSGDRQTVVDKVAKTLGIKEAHGDMLPADKHEFVETLQKRGRRVAMVGDGVNDAQALAAANVSMAMAASQCDLAIETADITLAREDLNLVVETLDISKKTMGTIKTNFVSSIGVNLGGLVLGASGNLSPFAAAIVHNLSTLAVVGNSMRLGVSIKDKKLNQETIDV